MENVPETQTIPISERQTEPPTIRQKKGALVSLFYRLADTLISCIIVLPITVGFVHGTWMILDVGSGAGWYGIETCLLIGFGEPFLLCYFQDILSYYIHPFRMPFLSFYAISRTLLVIHSIAAVFQWKGIWDSLDATFPVRILGCNNTTVLHPADSPMNNNAASLSTFFIATLLAIGLRTYSNAVGAPIVLGVDQLDTLFLCPLRFKTPRPPKYLTFHKDFKHQVRFIADCLFTVIVVNTLVITTWRGLWYTMEYYLYPSDRMFSILLSAIFGFVIVVFLGVVQPLYYDIMSGLHGTDRVALLALINFVAVVGSVFSYRACWELFKLIDGEALDYLTGDALQSPDTKFANHLITACVSIAIAIILGLLSTFAVRGVIIDGELAKTVDEDWPLAYASLLQAKDNSIPFPEPFVLYFLCTSRKVGPAPVPIVVTDELVSPENRGPENDEVSSKPLDFHDDDYHLPPREGKRRKSSVQTRRMSRSRRVSVVQQRRKSVARRHSKSPRKDAENPESGPSSEDPQVSNREQADN